MLAWEALDALSHQLELCKIDATSRVVLLLHPELTADRVNLIRAAVARTRAQALDVRPLRTDDPADHPLLMALVDMADVVITTSERHADFLADEPLDILLLEPGSSPEKFPPHQNLRRRVQTMAERLGGTSEILVSDRHGTALSIAAGGSAIDFDHGVLDSTNRRAAFPSGWVAITPSSGSVNGTLVLMPGDANITASHLVSSPVTFDIVDDHLTTIHGESADADVIRALLEYAEEPAAYGISQLAIGLNPGKQLLGSFDAGLLDPHHARLAAGIVTMSFGENLTASRPCIPRLTLQLSLPGRTATVDGLPLVSRGHLQGDFAPDVYELG